MSNQQDINTIYQTCGLITFTNHPINVNAQCYNCVADLQPQDPLLYYKGFTICSFECFDDLLCDPIFDSDFSTDSDDSVSSIDTDISFTDTDIQTSQTNSSTD